MPGRDTGKAAVADRTLIIERVFDAPRELVFEAWTRREHAERWWCPKGAELRMEEMDVRPGGTWRRVMIIPGRGDFRRSGVYREVTPPERLVFTYLTDDPDAIAPHETLVTVTFEDMGGRTKLTLRQEGFDSTAARDSHRGGWTTTLDRLGERLREMAR
jgi:uncharacterized protein YndB with AHSA1/START domain